MMHFLKGMGATCQCEGQSGRPGLTGLRQPGTGQGVGGVFTASIPDGDAECDLLEVELVGGLEGDPESVRVLAEDPAEPGAFLDEEQWGKIFGQVAEADRFVNGNGLVHFTRAAARRQTWIAS